MEEDLRKKAILSLGGPVRLPEGFELPFRVSRSTAGPGAGFASAVFAFSGMRVKKSITYDESEFELKADGDKYSITMNGEAFIDDVSLVPVAYHCPEQAFFNLDQRCIFHCVFCNSPNLPPEGYKGQSPEVIVGKIADVIDEQNIVAVSLTSGVVGSVEDTIVRFADTIKAVRKAYPSIRIGVEPYVSCEEHIVKLKDAGADEIKINLESSDEEVFGKACPDLNIGNIWHLLGSAIRIFGRGNVSSNIIFGMGETDASIETCFEKLAQLGVIPTARALRINDINREQLETVLGILEPVTPERMIRIAKMQKSILEKYGLTTLSCKTMCLECTCCDIVPFRDL